MKRKIYTIWTTLLVVILMATPVYAGNIKLSGSWGSGSIHFNGYATGVGGYDGITVEIIGYGLPLETLCINQGGNEAPGQNPGSVSVDGSIAIDPSKLDDTTTKGKTPVDVSAGEEIIIPGTDAGCPNDNWYGKIVNVDWTGATINVYEGVYSNPIPEDALMLKTFEYTCYPENKVLNSDGTTYTLDCELVSSITY